MAIFTTIPDTDIDPESPITTSLMQALRDNPLAIQEGDPSAPKIQSAAIADGAVTQAKIANVSVGQSELKTTFGTVGGYFNSGASATYTAPGGNYAFAHLHYASAYYTYCVINNNGLNGNGVYNRWVKIGNSDSGTGRNFYAYYREYYVQASPPYDLGDGEIPLFVFAKLDSNRNQKSIYVAPEAPWHYNGPTDIRATRKEPVSGRSWRKVLAVDAELHNLGLTPQAAIRQGLYTRQSLADRRAQDRATGNYAEIEITQAVKNADMPIIPHPFERRPGEKIVLLDPVSPVMLELLELHDQGEDVARLVHDGHLIIDNIPLNRAGPRGVDVVGVRWK